MNTPLANFCTLADVQSILPTSASRYGAIAQTTRDAVTSDILKFLRRNFDYDPAYVQYLDGQCLRPGEQIKVWPDKLFIDPDVPIDLRYSYERLYDDTSILTLNTDYTVNYEEGYILITPLYATRYAPMAYRIQYAAGCKINDDNPDDPIYEIDPTFRRVAIIETVTRLRSLIDLMSNEQENGNARARTIKKPLIGGLLQEVAGPITPYRKILMTVR